MKRKSLNKKLVLKKGVISSLNMHNVKGGEKEAYTNDEAMSCDSGCMSGFEACNDL